MGFTIGNFGQNCYKFAIFWEKSGNFQKTLEKTMTAFFYQSVTQSGQVCRTKIVFDEIRGPNTMKSKVSSR